MRPRRLLGAPSTCVRASPRSEALSSVTMVRPRVRTARNTTVHSGLPVPLTNVQGEARVAAVRGPVSGHPHHSIPMGVGAPGLGIGLGLAGFAIPSTAAKEWGRHQDEKKEATAISSDPLVRPANQQQLRRVAGSQPEAAPHSRPR
jgi:hypothetical protein